MGLEEQVQKKLGIPIACILKHHKTKGFDSSILDIFDASRFMQMILLPADASISKPLGNTYKQVWATLKQAADRKNISTLNYKNPDFQFLRKTHIEYEEEVINQNVWFCLQTVGDLLFQLMLKNEEILYSITEMAAKDQIQIKDYLENHEGFNFVKQEESPTFRNKQKGSYSEEENNMQQLNAQNGLIQKLEEMEQIIMMKDQEILSLKEKLQQSKEELSILKVTFSEKESENQMMKMKIGAYLQTDILFQEKDDQIAKLQSELSSLKLKSQNKTSQLSNELSRLRQYVKDLQAQKLQLLHTHEILSNKNQNLLATRDQGEVANKKVIANLKQKIKTLNDRLAQQQKNLMQVINEKQQREKQIFEMQKNNWSQPIHRQKIGVKKDEYQRESSRKSSKLVDELGEISNILSGNQVERKQYFSALFGDSEDKCTRETCIALRSQYVKVVQQILSISRDTESLTYMTPENRLQCILDQLRKIQDTIQQNMKLKQRIVLMQSQDKKGQSKQFIEQINKLKKQLLVLKRNNQQQENKHKQQLQVLISVMSQNFVFDIKS